MQLQSHTWESSLLVRAYEAITGEPDRPCSGYSPRLLARAYDQCDALTAFHSKSFYLASRWLPPTKRRAVRALYAFCRVTDDIVDCDEVDCDENERGPADDRRARRLDQWRNRVLRATPSADPVAIAWADARTRYTVPVRYSEQLIDGIAQDLTPRRYETFAELAAYCYGVASTVGLMGMHIIGYSSPDAIRYAIKLGVALQVTNILRDVGEDARAGRLYLPLEDLARFGVSEEDVIAGRLDERWRALMQYQVARNRWLYDEAMPGIAYLNPDGRFAITAAADFYRAILEKIEQADYDVFTRRASVSAWGKVRRLPDVWRRSRTRFATAWPDAASTN